MLDDVIGAGKKKAEDTVLLEQTASFDDLLRNILIQSGYTELMEDGTEETIVAAARKISLGGSPRIGK